MTPEKSPDVFPDVQIKNASEIKVGNKHQNQSASRKNEGVTGLTDATGVGELSIKFSLSSHIVLINIHPTIFYDCLSCIPGLKAAAANLSYLKESPVYRRADKC